MDGDRHAEAIGLGPEVGEPRVAQQGVLAHGAADLDGHHVEAAYRAVHLGDRAWHVLQRHQADALEPRGTHLAIVVKPVVVRGRAGRGEAAVAGHRQRELVGRIDDGYVDLVAVHVSEPSPRIIGAHPAIVDGLALRRGQVAVDADEADVGLGAPHLAVDETHDVAAARLRVAGAPLAVLRVDPLVGRVDLDHVSVAVDHQVGSVGHRLLLLRGASANATTVPRNLTAGSAAVGAAYDV